MIKLKKSLYRAAEDIAAGKGKISLRTFVRAAVTRAASAAATAPAIGSDGGLPDGLKNARYCEFGGNKTEQAATIRNDRVKGEE